MEKKVSTRTIIFILVTAIFFGARPLSAFVETEELDQAIILSREASRLSRSDKDWCHLLEVCRVFDTLIADARAIRGALGCGSSDMAVRPAWWPKTRPSRIELLASLLAPITPVDAASPQTNNPEIFVSASRLVRIPPTI